MSAQRINKKLVFDGEDTNGFIKGFLEVKNSHLHRFVLNLHRREKHATGYSIQDLSLYYDRHTLKLIFYDHNTYTKGKSYNEPIFSVSYVANVDEFDPTEWEEDFIENSDYYKMWAENNMDLTSAKWMLFHLTDVVTSIRFYGSFGDQETKFLEEVEKMLEDKIQYDIKSVRVEDLD